MIYHSSDRNSTIDSVLNNINKNEINRGLAFCMSSTLAIEYASGVAIRGIKGEISSMKQKNINCIIIFFL